MCTHGNTVILRVPIPAHLSHTGQRRWDDKPVDRCIAPLVELLNSAGVWTANCCCGHGHSPASILLHDGSCLIGDPLGWMVRHPPPGCDVEVDKCMAGVDGSNSPDTVEAATWIDVESSELRVG